MRLSGAVLFVLCVLGACAGQVPSNDAGQAILLADRACYEAWGKLIVQNGGTWGKKDWHAKPEGNHWKVWVGDEKLPQMSINVPRDGAAPKPGSCDLLFED